LVLLVDTLRASVMSRVIGAERNLTGGLASVVLEVTVRLAFQASQSGAVVLLAVDFSRRIFLANCLFGPENVVGRALLALVGILFESNTIGNHFSFLTFVVHHISVKSWSTH